MVEGPAKHKRCEHTSILIPEQVYFKIKACVKDESDDESPSAHAAAVGLASF